MSPDSLPLVSIILPCLNEGDFIGQVLADIDGQTYPKEKLEVWVVDGGSRDDTLAIAAQWGETHSYVHLLHNPDRFVPQAMNRGIRASRGTVIIRMDAHAGYPPDYVSGLVAAQQESGAENVGGLWVTRARADAPKAEALARVLSHPFGIGNARFRTGVDQPTEVDTVPFGCYPREVFQRFGLYDERLERNQDIELNKRIRRSGGRILLFPHIHCTYYARDTYSGIWRNNFATGRWVILTAFFTGHFSSLSVRHFIPFCFVSYLSVLFLWTLKYFLLGMGHPLEGLLVWPLWLYLAILLAASWQSSAGKRRGLFPWMPVAFLCLHLSYGVGSWKGILDLTRPEVRHKRKQQAPVLPR